MSTFESIIRAGVRGAMNLTERRIDRVALLGRALAEPVGHAAPPVLLVHGYGNTAKAMNAVERSLTRDGFRVFNIGLPERGMGDAIRDARFLTEKIAQVRAETGSATVDLIGHSRGGLVSRTAKQLMDEGGSVRRVVTVSSANQGVHLGIFDKLASLVLPDGMLQMRRGASLIENLHKTRPGNDLIAVGTNKFDLTLAPAVAAHIENAPFMAVDQGRTFGPVSKIGHWKILRDDVSYETIRGALLAQ